MWIKKLMPLLKTGAHNAHCPSMDRKVSFQREDYFVQEITSQNSDYVWYPDLDSIRHRHHLERLVLKEKGKVPVD